MKVHTRNQRQLAKKYNPATKYLRDIEIFEKKTLLLQQTPEIEIEHVRDWDWERTEESKMKLTQTRNRATKLKKHIPTIKLIIHQNYIPGPLLCSRVKNPTNEHNPINQTTRPSVDDEEPDWTRPRSFVADPDIEIEHLRDWEWLRMRESRELRWEIEQTRCIKTLVLQHPEIEIQRR